MAAKGAVVILALAGAGLAIALGGKKKKPVARRPGGRIDPPSPDDPDGPDAGEYPDDVNHALDLTSQAADTDCGVPLGDMQNAWQVLHDYNATEDADDNTRTAEMSLGADIAKCGGDSPATYPDYVQEAIDFALSSGDKTNLLEVQHYLGIMRKWNMENAATPDATTAEGYLTTMEAALIDFYGSGGTA